MSDSQSDNILHDNDQLHFDSDDTDMSEGFEVFKNVGDYSQLRTVRVALDKSGRANEQAPSRRTSRGGRDPALRRNSRGDPSHRGPSPPGLGPPFARVGSTASDKAGRLSSGSDKDHVPVHGPIVELSADRRESFSRSQSFKNQIKQAAKESQEQQKKKKKKRLKMPALSTRTNKIIAESNFNDDEARAANGPNQFNFLLATMVSGISYYYIFSLLVILTWSGVCTWYMEKLRVRAETEPQIAQIVDWFDETDVRMISSLFVFSLVFRFNQCYNRWWQGRMLWGEIIQNCLDFSRKATLWIVDKPFSDRLNRYIVVFPYACKAQLRGLSLTDESESGQLLVDRGFLAQEELDFLRDNPCWEPEFFLDLMRATVAKVILAQWDRAEYEQVLILPHSNRIHDRLFPPLDKAIYDLGNSIGEGVSVRSAGLPRSYDTVHYIFFWIYFFLAPMAEAATIGWLAPVLLGCSACIIMTLMDMGTAMVDPFGTDLVDLPIERFCETIEAQVVTIQRRHKDDTVCRFAESATARVKFGVREASRYDAFVNLTH